MHYGIVKTYGIALQNISNQQVQMMNYLTPWPSLFDMLWKTVDKNDKVLDTNSLNWRITIFC